MMWSVDLRTFVTTSEIGILLVYGWLVALLRCTPLCLKGFVLVFGASYCSRESVFWPGKGRRVNLCTTWLFKNCSLYRKTSSWRGYVSDVLGWMDPRRIFVAIRITLGLSSGSSPWCDPLTFVPLCDHERDWHFIGLWLTRCVTVC